VNIVKAAIILRLCRHRHLNFLRMTFEEFGEVEGQYLYRCLDCGKLVYRDKEAK
jgi:hypothetical protein